MYNWLMKMCAKSGKIFPAITVDITDYISVPVFFRQGVIHVGPIQYVSSDGKERFLP